MANKKLLCLYLCLLVLPITGLALPTDNQQPAHLTSNTADLNQKTGLNIFTGNVVITQGSTVITANQITTHNNAAHKMSEAIATGTPATYQTLPKVGGQLFQASASTIQYFPIKNLVILIGNGKLEQGGSVLQSDFIVYNQKTGQLTTKLYNKNRTTLILQPNQPS